MAIIGTNDTATVRVASLPIGAAFDTAANVTFSATGGISATNVQAAIAELDTEKAPLASPNFTGGISLSSVQQPTRFNLTVADDAVGSFTIPTGQVAVFVLVAAHIAADRSDGSTFWSGAAFLDLGATPVASEVDLGAGAGGGFDVSTSDLTSTPGTDGRVTIAARPSRVIQINNRSGIPMYFTITWF